MSLSPELISQFAKITNSNKKTRVEETTLYGTVMETDDGMYVQFDGTTELTPVTTIVERDDSGSITNYKYGAASVKTGDRVSVLLKNHSATITGNLSDPAMGRAEIRILNDSIVAIINDEVKVKIDEMGTTVNGILTITGELDDKIDGVSDDLSGKIDGVSDDLVNTNSDLAIFQQDYDTLKAGFKTGTTVINGGCIQTGLIEAQYINTEYLKVKAANIEGTLVIGKISGLQSELDSVDSKIDTVDSRVDTVNNKVNSINVPTKTSDLLNDMGYQTLYGVSNLISNTLANSGYVNEYQVTTITNNAISTASISANQITTGTLKTAYVKLDGMLQVVINGTTYGYLGGSYSSEWGAGAVVTGPNRTAYLRASSSGIKIAYSSHEIMCVPSGPKATSALIIDSDRRLKHDISYDMEKYEEFFKSLKPCYFHLNNEPEGKYRIGLIAQEVLEGALSSGLTEEDVGLVSQYEDRYGIAYSELISLNTHMIQNLMKTIEEQNARISKLESLLEEGRGKVDGNQL